MSARITTHFYNEIINTYADYVQSRKLDKPSNDIRMAMHAAGEIAHFREILPPPYNDAKSVGSLCPDYNVLIESVNAYKHHDRTKTNVLVRSSQDIKRINVSIEYKDVIGTYKHHENEVGVLLVDGSVRDLYEVMTNVLNFWFSVLAQLGMIDKPYSIDLDRANYVPRNLARGEYNLGTLSPVTYVDIYIKSMRYDPILNKVEPIGEKELQMKRLYMRRTENGGVYIQYEVKNPSDGLHSIEFTRID